MWNISFITTNAGGGAAGTTVNYIDNMIIDVSFDGQHAGGSVAGDVNYSNNTMINVNFTGDYSGGSRTGAVSYSNNHMTDILLSGTDVCTTPIGGAVYSNNALAGDDYDTDSDGLPDLYEQFVINTNPRSSDTDGDGLGDGWEVEYNGSFGVNPRVAATIDELASDMDNDSLNLTEEFKANSDPEIANISEGSSSGVIILLLIFIFLIIPVAIIAIVAVVAYRMRERIRAFVEGLRK